MIQLLFGDRIRAPSRPTVGNVRTDWQYEPERSRHLVMNPLVTRYVTEFIIKECILGQFQAMKTITDCSDDASVALREDDR